MKIFNSESQAQLSPFRRNLFAVTSLLIIIFSIYSNTFNVVWHFDDIGQVRDRKALHLKELNLPEIKKTLFHEKGKDLGRLYRPVANFTFALNYYFGKKNVFGYHLVNTTVHAVASIFLFLFIYHSLNLPLLRAKHRDDPYLIALVATVFWAINPVQTQAVTYIVQRMASMAAMFFIMAMYFYLKGRTSQKVMQKTFHFIACFVCALLAFGSKENAAMLPFCILLFDLFFIQGLTKKNVMRSLFIFIFLLIIPVGLALALKGTRIFGLGRFVSYGPTRPFTPVERLLTEPGIIIFYLSLLFYPMPQRLSITHDLVISKGLFDPPTTFIPIVTILLIIVICIVKAKDWPLISFCIIFFFLNHVTESSFFGLELLFEHRNYLPSMLLFVPLAVFFGKGLRFYSNKRLMQGIFAGFIVLVWVGFGHSTFMRNYDWKTEKSLWADAARKAPAIARPHINLGWYYAERDMYESALSEFEQALSSKVLNNRTNHPLALYNIGYVYQMMGDFSQALMYYRTSARQNPSNADTYNNMGVIFDLKGFSEEAERAYKEAIRLSPQYLKAHRSLALLSIKQGRIEEAFKYLEAALKLNPKDVGVLGSTGYVHRLNGSLGEAFLYFKRAINIEPHDAKLHLYLAEIYFKRGMEKEAQKSIKVFVRRGTDPDLRGYVLGTAPEEDKIAFLMTYKKMVLKSLAKAYEWNATHMQENIKYINQRVSEYEDQK